MDFCKLKTAIALSDVIVLAHQTFRVYIYISCGGGGGGGGVNFHNHPKQWCSG